ncbi:MAG: glycosyltransferase family 39 protein [Chloroflexota bacterium]
MTSPSVTSKANNTHKVSLPGLKNEYGIAFGLFLAALIPRLLALTKFVTADEPRWVVRSLSFMGGLLTADFEATLQTGHPGVTTMWSGTIGTALKYALTGAGDDSLLHYVQQLPHDYQQIDVTILPWMRFPVVLLSSLTVVLLYWLLRKLDQPVAILAALLYAFHPLYLGHSQLLHHDALVSVFITISILIWLILLQRWSWRLVILAGACTGFAILSKSTAYALLPFMGLTMLAEILTRRITFARGFWAGVVWGVTALLTSFLFWPALWVGPVTVWQTIVGWVADSADVDQVSNTLWPNFGPGMPDLGLFFYPINWALKTTPLMVVGLCALPFWWRRNTTSDQAKWWVSRLVLWIIVFSLLLTLGDKRDGRYLLPIYFALTILAAFGIRLIYLDLKTRWSLSWSTKYFLGNGYYVIFATLLLATSVTYYPYYLTYYNPFIGGPWLATKLIRVGWGDGMEEAAAWLNQQPEAHTLKVATIIEQSFWPFFAGQVIHHRVHEPQQADYVLNYVRQIQNGVPFNEYWQYYQAREPAFDLRVSGIDYLWLHQEAPLVTINKIEFADDLILRAYTLDQAIANPGETLEVTLIWRVTKPTNERIRVQLRDEAGKPVADSDPSPVIDPAGPSNVEGHYDLALPETLPRGSYQLWGTLEGTNSWHEVTTIHVGQNQAPNTLGRPVDFNFAGQIALHGVELIPAQPKAGETLSLKLHWQALHRVPLAYTTFIHILNDQGAVVAQTDVQPGNGQWPTDSWYPKEWLTDQVSVSLPTALTTGNYRILLGWYYWETGERLILEDTGENVAVLGEISIP